MKHIIIVGGGLVGALNACFLAKRGHKVDLYELREDIRKMSVVRGRSINLAVSERGLEGLAKVGLDQIMTNNGIPMYARYIHNLDGTHRRIQYGKSNQYIMSIDRRRLNELMLTAADKYPNVTIYFEHKLVDCDFEAGEAIFTKPNGDEVSVRADLIIGCDGGYSSMRRSMMKSTRINYSQEYVPHGYLELRIPPKKNNDFAMEKNVLHIWPRDTFMMIALPNVEDNSFVVTLFMSFEDFESLKTEKQVLDFFHTQFPDAVKLIGKESLVETYFNLKPLQLMTVKCSPYHSTDNAVLMGDAAHAMVPFFGQGMNCGFEDCIIFNDLMDKYNEDIGRVLEEYSAYRSPDAHAICDLAMHNYIEMRAHVNSKLFLVRKKVDNILHFFLGQAWIPLYSMVSFTRIRYHECRDRRRWQDKMLRRALSIATTATVVGGAIFSWKCFSDLSDFPMKEYLANNPLTNRLTQFM